MAASAQIVDQHEQSPQQFIAGSLPLNNQQWEQFAHAIASGSTQSAAARVAGYAPKTAHNTGSRLLKYHPEIVSRIQFLKDQNAKSPINHIATKDWVVTQAISAQQQASEEKNHPANVAYLQLISRLQGYVDGSGNGKRANSTTIDARTVNFFQVPTGQLRNALEAHLAEVPMAERAALLEAAPEIAEALNQAPAASVQDTFAGDSEQV